MPLPSALDSRIVVLPALPQGVSRVFSCVCTLCEPAFGTRFACLLGREWFLSRALPRLFPKPFHGLVYRSVNLPPKTLLWTVESSVSSLSVERATSPRSSVFQPQPSAPVEMHSYLEFGSGGVKFVLALALPAFILHRSPLGD